MASVDDGAHGGRLLFPAHPSAGDRSRSFPTSRSSRPGSWSSRPASSPDRRGRRRWSRFGPACRRDRRSAALRSPRSRTILVALGPTLRFEAFPRWSLVAQAWIGRNPDRIARFDTDRARDMARRKDRDRRDCDGGHRMARRFSDAGPPRLIRPHPHPRMPTKAESFRCGRFSSCTEPLCCFAHALPRQIRENTDTITTHKIIGI